MLRRQNDYIQLNKKAGLANLASVGEQSSNYKCLRGESYGGRFLHTLSPMGLSHGGSPYGVMPMSAIHIHSGFTSYMLSQSQGRSHVGANKDKRCLLYCSEALL